MIFKSNNKLLGDGEQSIHSEKNIGSFSNDDELKSVVSRHTADYDLYVAKSNPSAINQAEGHKLRQALDSRHVSMIALGGALGYVFLFHGLFRLRSDTIVIFDENLVSDSII